MQLLIAILIALYGSFEPGLTQEQILQKYPSQVVRAQGIMDSNAYTIEPETGIVIIDETGN